MSRRTVTMVLISVLVSLVSYQPVSGNSPRDKEARSAEKVKTAIVRLGPGEESIVNVRLRDKTKLVGYVKEINDSSFVIRDLKTSLDTTVPYPDVVQVKGNNLSTRTKIIITAAIIAGVAITLYIVRGAFCDGC